MISKYVPVFYLDFEPCLPTSLVEADDFFTSLGSRQVDGGVVKEVTSGCAKKAELKREEPVGAWPLLGDADSWRWVKDGWKDRLNSCGYN